MQATAKTIFSFGGNKNNKASVWGKARSILRASVVERPIARVCKEEKPSAPTFDPFGLLAPAGARSAPDGETA